MLGLLLQLGASVISSSQNRRTYRAISSTLSLLDFPFPLPVLQCAESTTFLHSFGGKSSPTFSPPPTWIRKKNLQHHK
jgi:hypothetical protein